MDDYLTKPIQGKRVMETLERVTSAVGRRRLPPVTTPAAV
jgi:hypothetical protein